MEKRQMRAESAAANLLVSPERHLPGRETGKEKPALFQEKPDVEHEGLLVRDVLNHVVEQYNVKLLRLIRGYGIFEEVGMYEVSVGFGLLKELSCIFNPPVGLVNAQGVAAESGEWQQIAAVAAPHFKHSRVAVQGNMPAQVADIEVV